MQHSLSEFKMSVPITYYLPELEEPESSFLSRLTATMSPPQIQRFAIAYRHGRKDPQTVLLMAVAGVVAIPGLHRFWLGQPGIGVLYLCTWGLLLFGSLSDIIKHKQLAFSYNRKVASRIANNLISTGERSSSISEVTFR